MQDFFILCSGADAPLLRQCTAGERNKYAGIGATVFFTAVMAFIAASYALYTVFDNYLIAAGLGVVWGLLIFNLDRYIVSTITKNGSKWHELLQAIPRLLLAIIIAVVISKPLELKIFEKEIDRVLLEERNMMSLENQQQVAALYAVDNSAFAKAVQVLKDEIASKEQEVNQLYNTYIAEAEGTAGTNKLGKGPVYQEKRDKHDAALRDLTVLRERNTIKINQLEQQNAATKANELEQRAASQEIVDNFDGLMARITALNKLPFWTSFFIFLLFLAIETSPILAKLLSPRGEYDYRFFQREQRVASWAIQQDHQRNTLVATDIELNESAYRGLANESEVQEYKKKIAAQLLKQQADAFYEEQKSVLGIRRG
ncbi:MAG: DUF4407 domain-containing protein [Nonlabens sp.]